MAIETTSEFDLGPLSWVQGEIDQALAKGLEALALFRTPPHDVSALKHARSHIHQAAGAIQMVGLDAVVAYTDEIERQLTQLEDHGDPGEARASCDAIDRACRKLQIFLTEIVNGTPPAPLKLFPEYEAMQRTRGIRIVAPTDLFYPDLSPRAPQQGMFAPAPAKLQSYLVKQRRTYQQGLLAWLRGESAGVVGMREAVGAIEQATEPAGLRAFWWTVGAVFDAVIHQGLEPDFNVKQLAARIDLQVRRVVEGSGKVADRLRREVLYFVAISAPVAPSVRAVQQAFRLAELIPSAEVMNADLVRIQPLLREAREQLSGAKEAWLKFTSGRPENLPKLKQTMASVHRNAAEVGHGALMKLTASLVDRLENFPTGNIAEPLAMEYATGMLLAENAFENCANLSAEFPRQVEAMLARLDAAQASRPLSGPETAPLLDEMSKRAQERLLLAQVVREIQANLRHMEQVLDGFFRDPGRRSELASLAKDSQQIRGALQMLDLDAADELLALCQAQISEYAASDAPAPTDDLELLAESLSGLGFYIEAVEQQRPDRERLIAPFLAKRRGEDAEHVAAADADSAEQAVSELRNALPMLVDEVHRAPADAGARDALKIKLAELRNDAELIGDADLATQASAALAELQAGGTVTLAAAVTAMAETSAPAPEISAETQRLLATDATSLDAELVEIYLTEAAEVLDTISEHLRQIDANPGDREALRTIRRGFHTLKGSGRMVGLMDLGEIAYDVEKIHNRLLEDERPVTRSVLQMITVAERDFRQWVAALSATGKVLVDPTVLHAAIRAVEYELPGGRESVLKTYAAPAAPLATATPELVLPAQAAVAPAAPEVPVEDAPATVEEIESFAVAEAPPSILDDTPSSSDDEAPWPEPEPVPLPDLAFELEGLPAAAAVPVEIAAVAEPMATPDLGSLPDALFELPELGSAGARDAAPTAVEYSDTLADEPVELAETGAGLEWGAEASPDSVASPETSVGIDALEAADFGRVAPESPAEVTVGEVSLSSVLFGILMDEADEHLATLTHGLSVLQFDPQQVPSPEMVRASHTLCGIHRTGGFPLVAELAKALEQCLLALQSREPPLPPTVQPALARAIAELGSLIVRIKSRAAFTADDVREAGDVTQELDLLRQSHSLELTDAETLAAQMAARDELFAPEFVPAPVSEAPLLIEAAPVDEATIEPPVIAATEGPVAEEPVAEEPVAEEPVAEEPVAEEPVAEEPVAEEPVAEEPVAEEPVAEEPVAEEPVAEEPVAEESVAEESVVEEPVVEAPVVEAPVVEEPVVEEPVVEESVIEAPVAEEPIAEEPVAEAPVVEEPVAEEPVALLPVEAVDPLADVLDDVDLQVLPIFLEEAAELFPRAGEELRAWARDPEFAHHASELRRTLHTFKGSARMAGAMRLGQLTHLMESRLLVGDAPAAGTPALLEALHSDLDNVAFVLDTLREGHVNVELPWVAAAHAAASDADSVERTEAAAAMPGVPLSKVEIAPVPPDAGVDLVPVASVAALPAVAPPAPAPVAPDLAPMETDAAQRPLLRVRADIIDRLVNEAGEVSIARARVEGELRALKANLLELTNSVIRLRKEVRELEIQGESQIQSRMSQVGDTAEHFDPLEFDRYTRFQELTRSLAEGVNDVSTVQQSLLRNLDDADVALVAQARLSRDVQQQLFAIRTVPFGSLSDRLYRILRQLAKELDKRANLEIRGAQVELDRAVLEKLVGPMEHLLRNALDHGIESPEQRVAAGKPETGEIALTVRQVGNEIAIELADDGRGINLEEIRAKAVAQNRLAADARPTPGQLIEYIFVAGFSTATQVTQVSGRGIGMDVVRSEIAALGGRIEVTTRVGQGTTFLIYLPLTLAVAQGVLVRAGGRLWALPAPMVEQVQQLSGEHLLERYVAGKLAWQGGTYPFYYLPRLLGDGQHRPETKRHNSVLLLRSGQSVVAVHVDEMVGNQEVVVKNIGPQLARVSGIAGATVLGNGEIVLIINPVQLAQRVTVADFDDATQERLVPGLAHGAMPVAGPPLVMVVDDSLTVRKITSRLLNREGFKVATAKDGVDALEALAGELPDLILLDIEMPRMDGFEFTRNLKNDPRLAHIPIIMITSRTAEKHRERARDLGVDLYLGKPYQEEELLRHLREMLSLPS